MFAEIPLVPFCKSLETQLAELLWEDVGSAANRTLKAPPKTWQKPAPRGIRRP